MMVSDQTHVGMIGLGATMPTIPLYASLDTPAVQTQRTFAVDQPVLFDGLGQTVVRRGSGHHQGGHFGPPSLSYENQEMFGLGQTVVRRGSGHHQGGHFGPPSLSYENQEMFGLGGPVLPGSEGSVVPSQDLFGLGQTVVRRGSGHHQGGHFGPPSLSYENQEMFGLGQTVVRRGSGHHQGGHFGPPSLSYENQEMFGLGDESSMF
jgi:hypothetical protein